jgi:hypothetical protein
MLASPPPTKDELTLRAALLISHFCRVRLRRLETLTWDDVDVRADVVGVVVNGERLEIARHTDPFLDLGATLEALSDIRGDAPQILEGGHRWWSERFRLSARRLAIDGWTSGGYAGRDADSETLWRCRLASARRRWRTYATAPPCWVASTLASALASWSRSVAAS